LTGAEVAAVIEAEMGAAEVGTGRATISDPQTITVASARNIARLRATCLANPRVSDLLPNITSSALFLRARGLHDFSLVIPSIGVHDDLRRFCRDLFRGGPSIQHDPFEPHSSRPQEPSPSIIASNF
jgi:hypothetical protein